MLIIILYAGLVYANYCCIEVFSIVTSLLFCTAQLLLEKFLNVLVHLIWVVLLHPVAAARDAPVHMTYCNTRTQ